MMRTPHWQPYLVGAGTLERHGAVLRLATHDASATAYSDAQIDDYHGLRRSAMRWRPPLTLQLRARFSHHSGALCGTAGFGFWNHPVLLPHNPFPALPRAVWFFYDSPPSDMRLDALVAGTGWKAATIDASRWPFLALAPLAPFAFPLMRIPFLSRALAPIAQVALGVREAPVVADMRGWHRYTLRWEPRRARFWVDDVLLLDTPFAPRAPLGFVAWLDNQYAVVTPQGRFSGGLIAAPGTQWLDIESLRIGE